MSRRSPAFITEPMVVDIQADTQERLLLVAIRLFARYGIDGVSLRAISDAAGNRNKSAVGYHFDSKDGLINAVLTRMFDELGPKIGSVLTRFEAALECGEDVLIDEVVLELLTPALSFYATKEYGPDGLRVLARIMHDPVQDIPLSLRTATRVLTQRTTRLLQRLLRRKSLADVEHHVLHALMATVNGLALQKRYLETATSLWGASPLEDIFLSYASYVVAGLSAGALDLGPIAINAWKARLRLQRPAPVSGAADPAT